MNDMIDKIVQSRILFIDGEIDTDLANDIILKMLYLDSLNHEDINLYINSPGGELMSGLAIIDVMNSIKSNVNTICIGTCYSMAAVILVCGNKGKRAILPNSEVMIHEVGVTHIGGKAKEVISSADRMKEKNDGIINIIEKNTKLKIDKIKEIIINDYYMNAKEALENGFVDTII